jgi:hypothetical protein
MHQAKNLNRVPQQSTLQQKNDPNLEGMKSMAPPPFQLKTSGGGTEPNPHDAVVKNDHKSVLDGTPAARNLPVAPTAVDPTSATDQQVIQSFFTAMPWAAAMSKTGSIGLSHFIDVSKVDETMGTGFYEDYDGHIKPENGNPIKLRLGIQANSLDETFDLKEVISQTGEATASTSIPEVVITASRSGREDAESILDHDKEISGKMAESHSETFVPQTLIFVGDHGGRIEIHCESAFEGKLGAMNNVTDDSGMRIAPFTKDLVDQGFDAGSAYHDLNERMGGTTDPKREVKNGQQLTYK